MATIWNCHVVLEIKIFIDKYLSFVNTVSEPAIETLDHKAIRLFKRKIRSVIPSRLQMWKV